MYLLHAPCTYFNLFHISVGSDNLYIDNSKNKTTMLKFVSLFI